MCYAARLDFSCTNNIAKYEALLLGLRKLRTMGIRRAILKTDSQVISGHIDKSSKARDPKLEKYLDIDQSLEASFEGFSVKNIPKGENEHADLLAKSAAQGLPLPSEVFFETIKAPSVDLMERAMLAISPVHSEYWRTEIISFLKGNCLSDDKSYNKRMEARTRPYVCDHRRGTIQAWSLFSTPQVFIQNRRYRINEGDTCRSMWISYWA
jgi:hypothetical protein